MRLNSDLRHGWLITEKFEINNKRDYFEKLGYVTVVLINPRKAQCVGKRIFNSTCHFKIFVLTEKRQIYFYLK